MNNELPQVKTVKLKFVMVDEQQQAMFRMAFKMHNTTNYQILTPDDMSKPELVIVDCDKDGGGANWQRAKGDYPNSIVVYFSKNTPTITAPYLAKPIKFDSLFISLRNLLQGNGVWVVHQGNANNAQRAGRPAVAQSATVAEKPSAQKRAKEVAIPQFDAKFSILAKLREMVVNQHDIAIVTADNRPVLAAFPKDERVWIADARLLKQLCSERNPEIRIKKIPANNNLKERTNSSLEACFWQMAIWTANGRLVQPLNPHTKFRLKNWPNLTRLAPLPETIRLSAFLSKTETSLNMLYKIMPLDMADILNYLTVTYLTDHLEIVEQVQEQETVAPQRATVAVPASKPTPAPARRPAPATRVLEEDDDDDEEDDDVPQKSTKGGLLSRLLGRLLNK